MKALSIIEKPSALGLLLALGGPGTYAPSEIDPYRFESQSAEPHPQPRTLPSRVNATRYDGNFALPYAVQW